MRILLITCLLAAVAVTVIYGQTNDTTAQGDQVYLKVLGHSGKIIIGWQENVSSDDRRVEIELDGLQELDSNGVSVGHSFNTFANQDFKFSSLQQGTIGSSNSRASFFTFNSKLKDLNSTVTVTIYILNENGTVTLDGETTPMKKDDVKISIKLETWTWCSATANKCSADGAYVDLTVAVKSKGTPQKKSKPTGDAETYSLGYGSFLLSKKVEVDGGSWQNMPANYPKFESKGSRQLFTFRFPKFTSSVLYDPTVSGETSADTTGCGHLAVGSTLLLILAAALSKMLANY